MKALKRKRRISIILLSMAVVLVISGAVRMGQVFTRYNNMFLDRQDAQLAESAVICDNNIALRFGEYQESMEYVMGRKGFIMAEETWLTTGDPSDLLFRMEENLVTQDELIVSMTVFSGEELLLATDGRDDYMFLPVAQGEKVRPCMTRDGELYLAIIREKGEWSYAAMLNLRAFYSDVARMMSESSFNMMLLDRTGHVFLHQWQGETNINAVNDLKDNCDRYALSLMQRASQENVSVTESYHLQVPGEDHVHEMRMAVLPMAMCSNGHFTVGLTGAYDEVILPMRNAAIDLIFCGGITMGGVVLLIILALQLARRSHASAVELRSLRQRNEEIQRMLEKTQELSHHQRLETIGTMASSIAHEFNNLLTPIMGYSILTLEGLPAGCEDLCDNVTEIYEASRKAKTIIARMNDLARKNTGVAFRYFSLDEQVRRALQVASPARPPKVEVETDLNCADAWLFGNETQIAQLLLNLIVNAFHAMEGCGGTLTLTTRVEDDQAVLRVRDTGTGIPEEILPRVFDPFFTTKESGKGTGLGLAIAHQVVESHRGSMSVESTPDKGTVFTVCLPLSAQEDEE